MYESFDRFGERLPERLLFASKLKALSADISERAIVTGKLSEEATENTKTRQWIVFENRPETLLATSVLGASHIMIDSFMPAGAFEANCRKDSFCVDVLLMKDGEDYLAGNDRNIIEKAGAYTSNNYLIVANPDMPPYAINFELIHVVAPDDYYDPSTLVSVLEQFGHQAVHQLTDADCEAVVNSLTQLAEYVDFDNIEQMHGDPNHNTA